MADLFRDYEIGPAWDEMFSQVGNVRPSYEGVGAALAPLTGDELSGRVDLLARTFLDRGVTFGSGGDEQAFPLDLVPRIIDAEEWQTITIGVAQRVRALEAFLADVYGDCRACADGVIPRSLIGTSQHFHRAAAGFEPPNGVRIHIAGTDIIRDQHGTLRVLEDNVRTPSGVSYVLENRRAVIQAFPEAFGAHRVRPVSNYPGMLLAALRRAAPGGTSDPTVVVLTPGIYNSAYAEHSLLARRMGVELVEGRDLVCADNRVRMRTTAGERRVDVIYRRVDDDFLDPMHFRGDSIVGCPGLLNAARAGNVTLANAVGNGVADDKLIYTYVPDLIRYYLSEEPVLSNVETFRLDDPKVLADVLGSLDELVLKPVDGSGGKGIVIGQNASRAELDRLRASVLKDPRGWIAQPLVQLSTVPTLIGERLRPRHVDLRPFAVNDGRDVWVLPGGLTRVGLPEGSFVVNSSQGGGSKDTWVLDGAPTPAAARSQAQQQSQHPAPVPGPTQEPGPAAAQAQQQQQ